MSNCFATMYEHHKGNILPSSCRNRAANERIGRLSKAMERARQTFIKSAVYAGFIDQSTGRFVKPGNASTKVRDPS